MHDKVVETLVLLGEQGIPCEDVVRLKSEEDGVGDQVGRHCLDEALENPLVSQTTLETTMGTVRVDKNYHEAARLLSFQCLEELDGVKKFDNVIIVYQTDLLGEFWNHLALRRHERAVVQGVLTVDGSGL